jgi:hypothetical protein
MVSQRVCLRVEGCGPDVGHLPGDVRGVDMGHDRCPNVMALILEIRTERFQGVRPASKMSDLVSSVF